MSTRTWTANRDARTTTTPSDMGGGACDHLCVGTYSGYDYMSHVHFAPSWSGIPSASAISNATLKLYRAENYHVAPSSGTLTAYLMSSNKDFVEGTSGHPMTSTNGGGIHGSTRGTTTGSAATAAIVTGTGSWQTVDVTALVQSQYGQSVVSFRLSSSSGCVEYASREQGNPAVVVITYTANSAPSAPTLVSPASGGYASSLTPTLSFTPSDPDGDACTGYEVQVSTDSAFATATHWDYTWTGSATNGVQIDLAYSGTALSRSTTYWWRVRTKDAANGYGSWSAGRSFRVYALPVAAYTVPLSGQTCRLFYTAGSNTTPKMSLDWSFSDDDGHTQGTATVTVYADSAGSKGAQVYTTTLTQSATTADLSGFTPTNGSYYWITLSTTCSEGAASSTTSAIRTRVRWGRASYYYDIGSSAATSWGTPETTATIPSNSSVVMEYAATAHATAASEPSTWYAAMGDVPIPAALAHNYVWHRVTMFAWGSATPTSPTLSDVTMKWNTYGSTLDSWDYVGPWFSLDAGSSVYGTQSLRATLASTSYDMTWQTVQLKPNTTYKLQVRIKSQGNSGARVRVSEADGSAVIATTDTVAATQDWTLMTASFDSGGRDSARVEIRVGGSSAGNRAWFDAVKLEASTVVSPWSPGYVGGPAVIDSGGMQVDASAGGVLRMRAGGGGTRDMVELAGGASGHGLLFASDTQLYSAAAGHLTTGSGQLLQGTMVNLVADGTTDNSATLQAAVDACENGSVLYLRMVGTGKVGLGSTVSISKIGLRMVGLTMGVSTSFGLRFLALSNLGAASLIEWRAPAASNINEGAGGENFNVDMNGKTGHGITLYRGYNSAGFRNVRVVNVADAYSAFRFMPQESAASNERISQGVYCENIWGSHLNNTATAPAMYLDHMQESVFVASKGFGGAGTVSACAAPAWEVIDCRGVQFIGCSAACTRSAGFLVESSLRQSDSIAIHDATYELVGGDAYSADATTDLVTLTAAPSTMGIAAGQVVRFVSLGTTTGVTTGTTYYARSVSGHSFKVATTNSDATIVNITASGSGYLAYDAPTSSANPYGDTKLVHALGTATYDVTRVYLTNPRYQSPVYAHYRGSYASYCHIESSYMPTVLDSTSAYTHVRTMRQDYSDLGSGSGNTLHGLPMYVSGKPYLTVVSPALNTPKLYLGASTDSASYTGIQILTGTGAPADNTPPVGSLYLRSDGGATTTLYVKTGATTWTAK